LTKAVNGKDQPGVAGIPARKNSKKLQKTLSCF